MYVCICEFFFLLETISPYNKLDRKSAYFGGFVVLFLQLAKETLNVGIFFTIRWNLIEKKSKNDALKKAEPCRACGYCVRVFGVWDCGGAESVGLSSPSPAFLFLSPTVGSYQTCSPCSPLPASQEWVATATLNVTPRTRSRKSTPAWGPSMIRSWLRPQMKVRHVVILHRFLRASLLLLSLLCYFSFFLKIYCHLWENVLC